MAGDDSRMVDDDDGVMTPRMMQQADEMKEQIAILSSIPGFTTVFTKKQETKTLGTDTLAGLIEVAKKQFPQYKFQKADIDLRNKDRETIDARIKKLEKNYLMQKRKLDQRKSVLDETEETDGNIEALIAEIKTTETITDPLAVRQRNREIRERNRIERDAAAEEAQALIAQENALAGLTRKRRKRVIEVEEAEEGDEEAEGGDDDDDGAEEEALRRRLALLDA